MTRKSLFVVSCIMALTTACGDAGIIPPKSPGSTTQPVAGTVLAGIVAMSDEATPRLGLSQDGALIILVGHTVGLEDMMGMAVKVAGSFRDDGAFDVVQYWPDESTDRFMARARP